MHKVFCEDYMFVYQFENRIFCGVFDGCSSGKESYFASGLFGKVFKKNAEKQIMQAPDGDNDSIMQDVLFQSIIDLKRMKTELNLSIEEMLATAVLLMGNLDRNSATAVAIGDGFIALNEKFIEIDQNNQPDYLAYHFNKFEGRNEFEDWYKKLEHKYDLFSIKDVTIATDGISSFDCYAEFIPKGINNEENSIDPIHYLLRDLYLINNPAMLGRKCNILKNKYGYVNNDDLAIIRLVNI